MDDYRFGGLMCILVTGTSGLTPLERRERSELFLHFKYFDDPNCPNDFTREPTACAFIYGQEVDLPTTDGNVVTGVVSFFPLHMDVYPKEILQKAEGAESPDDPISNKDREQIAGSRVIGIRISTPEATIAVKVGDMLHVKAKGGS